MEKKEDEYTYEEFVTELKKISSKFSDNKSDLNVILKSGIYSFYYKTSKGKIEKQIACSCVPVIKMFCQLLGFNRSYVTELTREMNSNEMELNGKRGISTFSLIYHKRQTIQSDRITKPIDYFRIDTSKISSIKRLVELLNKLSKFKI